jgi:GNAT superfamily N-acetyltransferase
MTNDHDPFWRLSEADCAEAAGLLTRAFDADPLYATTVPDPDERAQALPAFFGVCLRYGCRFGEALATGRESGRMEAVAFWLPYPEARWSAERLAAVDGSAIGDLLPNAFQAVMDEVRRDLGPIFAPCEAAGHRDVPLLGVEPSAQGHGLGGALLARIISDAATARRPVTLWTANRKNVSFYQRHGFKLLGSGAFQNGAIPWWALSAPAAPNAR